MSQRDKVQWLRPEPGALEGGPAVKVVRVRPNAPVSGFFLSEQCHCVVTHWLGGRTKPCVGMHNGCEGCKVGLDKRPKAYVAVAVDNSGVVWLLEITERAYDENLRLCATSGLRGLYFTARRKHENINSELILEFNDSKRPAQPLPQDIDVPEVLCRIWFGKENNKTRKVTGNG